MSALWWYWLARDYYNEGVKLLDEALTAGGKVSTAVTAKALFTKGILSWFGGEEKAAYECTLRSLELNEHIGDKRGIAWSSIMLGIENLRNEPFDQSYFRRALSIGREVGDTWIVVNYLRLLGVNTAILGKGTFDMQALDQILVLCREVGDKVNLNWLLHDLGIAAVDRGDFPRATGLLREALEVSRQLGYRWGETQALNVWGISVLYNFTDA